MKHNTTKVFCIVLLVLGLAYKPLAQSFFINSKTIKVYQNGQWSLLHKNRKVLKDSLQYIGFGNEPMYATQTKYSVDSSAVYFKAINRKFIAAKSKGFWGVLNTKGHWVIQPRFTDVEWIANRVKIGQMINGIKCFALFNHKLKQILPFEFAKLETLLTNRNYWIASDTASPALSGVYQPGAGWVIKPQYKLIDTAFGLIKVQRADTLKKLFDLQGKPVANVFAGSFIRHPTGFWIADSAGLMGIANQLGWVLTPKYKKIEIRDSVFTAYPYNKFEVWDSTGLLLNIIYADSVICMANWLAIKRNNGWALTNPNGRFITNPVYDTIYPLTQNLFALQKGSETYLTNPYQITTYNGFKISGISHYKPLSHNMFKATFDEKTIVITEFLRPLPIKPAETISIAGNNLLWVGDISGYGLTTQAGKKLTFNVFNNIQNRFTDSVLVVKTTAGIGAINQLGNWMLGPVFDSLQHLADSVFIGKLKGDAAFKFYYTSGCQSNFSFEKYSKTPNGFYIVTDSGNLGLASATGKVLLPAVCQKILNMGLDSTFGFCQNGSWGLINSNGKLLIPPNKQIKNMLPGSDGFYPAKMGLWGFVDSLNRLRISTRYDSVKPFAQGLAAVNLIEKWGYINKKEKLVIQPEFQLAGLFADGIAVVKQKNKYGLIDTIGGWLAQPIYDTIFKATEGGGFVGIKNGLEGRLKPNGWTLIQPNFNTINYVNGFYLVSVNQQFGLLNQNAKTVIPVTYQNILPCHNTFITEQKNYLEIIKYKNAQP